MLLEVFILGDILWIKRWHSAVIIHVNLYCVSSIGDVMSPDGHHWNHYAHDALSLTHWGRVAHSCVSKLTIICSDNGLSPGRCQAIIWNNAGIVLIRILDTSFSEILSEIHTFSFRKMYLKISSVKFCLGSQRVKSSHWISFEVQASTHLIYSCPIFKWFAETWLRDWRLPGQQHRSTPFLLRVLTQLSPGRFEQNFRYR